MRYTGAIRTIVRFTPDSCDTGVPPVLASWDVKNAMHGELIPSSHQHGRDARVTMSVLELLRIRAEEPVVHVV